MCVCVCVYVHGRDVGHGLQGGGVAYHLVQGVDDVGEAWPSVAVLLPAVQHELVQSGGAVHRGGQPVVLLNGVDDLRAKGRGGGSH